MWCLFSVDGCPNQPQLCEPQCETAPSPQPIASSVSVAGYVFYLLHSSGKLQAQTAKMGSSFQIIKYRCTLLSHMSLTVIFFYWLSLVFRFLLFLQLPGVCSKVVLQSKWKWGLCGITVSETLHPFVDGMRGRVELFWLLVSSYK